MTAKKLRAAVGWQNLQPKKSSSSRNCPLSVQPLPRPFIAALQEELKRGTDLCQAEFAEMLSLGAWFPKELPKVFIHHQIHFVYARRFAAAHNPGGYANYFNSMMQAQELAYLRHFDSVITFSEADRQTLLSQLPAARVWNSPFPIPANVAIVETVTAEFDGRFLFVASEEHSPNRDALDWLLAEIWPQILQKLPAARLVIIGR